ncbi:MAG: hypothetical protein RIR69_257 [Actinomycetota bacterium]|jgi:methionine-rich copper-binding protein CopC
MKKIFKLALAVTLAVPLAIADVSPSQTAAVGTWVSRSATAALGIAIRADGAKYMVARGTALWGPMNWGSFVTTNSSPTVFSQSWPAVSVATNSGGTHCVAGESGATITIRYSTTDCASWTQKTLVDATTGSVNSVAISDNGQRMFATTSTGALFTSVNTGNSFTQRTQTATWTDVAVDTQGDLVVGATSDGQVLRSSDVGVNFSSVFTIPAEITNKRINAIASSSNGSVLMAAADHGAIYKSNNSGSNWAALTIPNPNDKPVADIAISADGSKVLAALSGGKLLRSTDSGSSWVAEDVDRDWKTVAMSSSGVHLGAGTDSNFYTSSIELKVETSSPSAGSTTALNDANIVLNFNNKITLGTGKNFYIKNSDDDSLFETIPSNDSRITASTVGRLTIDPAGTFSLGSGYYITSDSGTVIDDHGNSWDSLTSPISFTTSTIDSVPPTIKTKNPSSQSVRPQTTDNFSFTFNEAIEGVEGKYIQICYSNNTCTINSERLRIGDESKVTISGDTVTLNPETEFALNSSFYVRIEAGAFRDLNGNLFAGLNTDTFQIYTVAFDGRAPVFRRACVASDGRVINLLYDERLQVGTLLSSDFSVTSGGVAQAIESVVVPPYAAHVVITLINPVSLDSDLRVSYSRTSSNYAGAIQDSNPNYSASISNVDANSQSDCAGPLVESIIPQNGATAVPINASVSITFNEQIQKEFGKTLVIYNDTSGGVIESIHSSSSQAVTSGNRLTITPSSPLPSSTSISVFAIYSGFVEDVAGNDFWGWEGRTIHRFTTGTASDTTAPSAPQSPELLSSSDSGSSSSDRITSDSTPTVRVTAQENGGLVTIVASKAGEQDVPCSIPGSTTPSNCTFSNLNNGAWTLVAYHDDASGNRSSSSEVLNITIDTSSPILGSILPSSGAANVSRSSNITLTFSESVFKSSGTVTVLSGATCSTIESTISVSTSNVSISSNEVVINPSGSFDENTRYCLTYSAGVFEDVAGNPVPAMTLSSAGRVIFDTAANPILSAVITSPSSPANSRTLSYAVTFSEDVSSVSSGDFFNDEGTATCSFAVNNSSGQVFSVVATCTTDGTLVLALRANSVMNSEAVTGPAADVRATRVTIDTSRVGEQSSTNTLPTQSPPAADSPSGTTLPPVGTVGNQIVQGVQSTMPSRTTVPQSSSTTTTTTLPAREVPNVSDGGGALLVDGERIEATIARENNQLLISVGELRARISAVKREGGRIPLDSQGRIRMDQGDSIEIDVTGFGRNSIVEVRMYSDPVLLGKTSVSSLGALAASYEVPDTVEDGRHRVVLFGESQEKEELTFALSVYVGDESSGPSTLAILVAVPLGIAIIGGLIIPAILRRRREESTA